MPKVYSGIQMQKFDLHRSTLYKISIKQLAIDILIQTLFLANVLKFIRNLVQNICNTFFIAKSNLLKIITKL